jgi:hypothetical protein
MMWLKLGGLAVLTLVLSIAVTPVRTHSVLYDPASPPRKPSIFEMFGAMYLTPGTALLLAIIIAAAGFAAVKIARGQW